MNILYGTGNNPGRKRAKKLNYADLSMSYEQTNQIKN